MAEEKGYSIIRNAVRGDLVQEAVNVLSQHPTEKRRREKYIEYEVPPVCLKIRDEFIKNADRTALTELCAPRPAETPSVDVGKFLVTEFDPKKFRSARKGDIYVTFALTPLSPSNGWFVLYEGSRNQVQQMPNKPTAIETEEQRSPPLKPVELRLSPGDAVAWRGDLIYIFPPGGGGLFETLTYRI